MVPLTSEGRWLTTRRETPYFLPSLLDRWWLGIHHGAISASQLDYYLDEFTFRFNRRRSRARGLLFYRLLQQAVKLEPVPYKKLVGGRPSSAPQI